MNHLLMPKSVTAEANGPRDTTVNELFTPQNVINATIITAEKIGSRYVNDSNPGICRKCYIHPLIFSAYLNGSLGATLKKRINAQVLLSDRTSLDSAHTLSEIELALLDFLKEEVA